MTPLLEIVRMSGSFCPFGSIHSLQNQRLKAVPHALHEGVVVCLFYRLQLHRFTSRCHPRPPTVAYFSPTTSAWALPE
eukprot:6476817-Amphidinium_carterae.1